MSSENEQERGSKSSTWKIFGIELVITIVIVSAVLALSVVILATHSTHSGGDHYNAHAEVNGSINESADTVTINLISRSDSNYVIIRGNGLKTKLGIKGHIEGVPIMNRKSQSVTLERGPDGELNEEGRIVVVAVIGDMKDTYALWNSGYTEPAGVTGTYKNAIPDGATPTPIREIRYTSRFDSVTVVGG